MVDVSGWFWWVGIIGYELSGNGVSQELQEQSTDVRGSNLNQNWDRWALPLCLLPPTRPLNH